MDDDPDDEDLDEREDPDSSDYNDDEGDRCSHCGEEIYDDVERCPYCGEYVTESRWQKKQLWFIIAAIICVLIAIGWALSQSGT